MQQIGTEKGKSFTAGPKLSVLARRWLYPFGPYATQCQEICAQHQVQEKTSMNVAVVSLGSL